KTFLEPHIEDWHLECWAWLLRHLGGVEALRARELVLPTGKYFPRIEAQGHARAEEVFLRVKRLMGIESWPCKLVARQREQRRVGEHVTLQKQRGVAGTFMHDAEEVIVTYDPDLLERPYALISTLAHECAHYILHDLREPAPGAAQEPKLNELATDVAV